MQLRIAGTGGFTLIEILVALGVLAIGVTSVFALLATGGATHRKAVSQTAAAFISESVFSELRERFDVTIEDAIDLEVADGEGKVSGYPGFTYRLELRPLDTVGDEYLAICTVKWKKAGAPVTMSFVTVVSRRLPASAKGLMLSPTEEPEE
ncbi:MAG: type IV pilus modification PilV family protein [Planctomycetota bacterium]|jgi:prepilin-type N-terminal cleavage/methylation domain-containing protein